MKAIQIKQTCGPEALEYVDLPVPEPSAYLLRSPVPGLNIGDAAPDLTVTRDDGTTFQLSDLQGQPIRLADLREAAEKVANAMQAIGLDRWPRFLADAQVRAREGGPHDNR